ncbi:MAG: hypothetical protein J5833_08475 [Victivallales bacterium]|nr:hypothetical protein [Victivallales bacterium]
MKVIRNLLALLLLCSLSIAFESKAKWIWRAGDKAEYGEKLLYRKEIVLDNEPAAGYFNVIGDDHFDVYLNGELLFKQSGFVAHTVDAKKLRKGKNVIAAVITNDKDIAGLLVYGEIELPGRKMTLVTDGSWKVHSPDIIDADDWKQPDYESSKWPLAAEVSGVTTKNVWRRLIKREMFLSKEEFQEVRDAEIALEENMRSAHQEAARRLATEAKAGDVQIVRVNNVPYVSLDNGRKLSAPFFNSVSYSALEDAETYGSLQKYGGVGYEVATASARMADLWLSEDEVDASKAENAMLHILSAFKDAYLILFIDLRPPDWFVQKYPDELIRYGSGAALEEGDDAACPVPRPSMASELWMSKSGKALEKFIRMIEASDVGKRIIGYQLNYGVYSEWHYFGMERHMPDVGGPMQKAFAKYLRKAYKDDKSLQDAWRDTSVSLDNAAIPSAEKRLLQRHDKPFAPGEDRRCLDFYDCMALAVNDCQTFFNSTVRKACARKVLVGNYSGYFFSMPYPAVAFQTRTPEMLDSPAVDYQVSPFSYYLWHRGSGGTGLPRSPFETYALHGKLEILEADNRTHQATTRSGNDCKDANDSIGQICREFCNALTRGCALWYYDFNVWWYDYPEYYELFPKLLQIWKEGNDARRISQVAAVCDFDSIPYHTAAANSNKFTDTIIGEACNELYYAGAPFDSILLEDIGKAATPEYKLYVFFNLVNVTPEKRQVVEKLLESGATLLFVCAPELEKSLAGRPNAIFCKDVIFSRQELGRLIREKGIHIYSEDRKAVLFASNGLVGIHRKEAGAARISLPRKARKIEQLLPERKGYPPSDSIEYEHGPSGTSLFRISY